jgi:hypothetical protein
MTGINAIVESTAIDVYTIVLSNDSYLNVGGNVKINTAILVI